MMPCHVISDNCMTKQRAMLSFFFNFQIFALSFERVIKKSRENDCRIVTSLSLNVMSHAVIQSLRFKKLIDILVI